MPRPRRCRRICHEPAFDRFAPCTDGAREQVELRVDEFETIRLIDWEKRTHEQCAAQMGVSRTTVTETYEQARAKLADCLVNGKALRISGGHYALCDGSAWTCCGKRCPKSDRWRAQQTTTRKEGDPMKIAVTYENGNVFPHFGHTEMFKVYAVEDGKVVASQLLSTNGNGHGALAGMLSTLNVDTLICGGIGGGAQTALHEAGIRLYGGVSGSADEAVNALLAGTLAYDPNARCDHHGEGHHHHDGEHHCGESKHGCGGNGCH